MKPSIYVIVFSFSNLNTFQAWITLGRAQLNFGEPDSATESFDRALAIKVLLHCNLVDGLSP